MKLSDSDNIMCVSGNHYQAVCNIEASLHEALHTMSSSKIAQAMDSVH